MNQVNILSTDDQLDQRFYNQGYNAFTKGHVRDSNPHEPGFLNHDCWDNGWFAACIYQRGIELERAERQELINQAKAIKVAKQKRNAQNRINRANASRERLRNIGKK